MANIPYLQLMIPDTSSFSLVDRDTLGFSFHPLSLLFSQAFYQLQVYTFTSMS